MKLIMLVSLMAVPLLALVTGCSSTPKERQRDPASLVGKWRLTLLEGKEEPTSPESPFIEFGHENTVTGFTGVNRFNGMTDPVELAAGRVTLAQLATTRRAGPPAAMEMETKFLRALAGVTNWDVSGSRLTLSGQNGSLLGFEHW